MQKMRKSSCDCAESFVVIQTSDYRRVKAILNQGRHPTFIGRQQVLCAARNGGVLVFCHAGKDVAVALVNPRLNVLTVLCVLPLHRRHGLGSACLTYLQCSFARVLEAAVPFFERNGYVSVSKLKRGRSLNTQVMVRKDVMELAGRISRIYSSA